MPYLASQMRGDYGVSRGDPGLFSFIGGGLKAVGGIIGGPAGAAARAVGTFIAPTVQTPSTSGARNIVAPQYSMGGPGPGSQIQVPSQLRPGTTMPAVVGVSSLGTLGVDTSLSSWRGYHPNRSAYYTRAGKVEKGTRMVRNRSTNYGNGRALKKALRRAHGFQRLARGVMSFTLTGKKYTRPHFKKARGR